MSQNGTQPAGTNASTGTRCRSTDWQPYTAHSLADQSRPSTPAVAEISSEARTANGLLKANVSAGLIIRTTRRPPSMSMITCCMQFEQDCTGDAIEVAGCLAPSPSPRSHVSSKNKRAHVRTVDLIIKQLRNVNDTRTHTHWFTLKR